AHPLARWGEYAGQSAAPVWWQWRWRPPWSQCLFCTSGAVYALPLGEAREWADEVALRLENANQTVHVGVTHKGPPQRGAHPRRPIYARLALRAVFRQGTSSQGVTRVA